MKRIVGASVGGVRSRRRGVTLLEITLAMGLLVVLSSMTYWFYSSSLTTSREGTKSAQKLRLARVVLDRIATEIRQAARITADNRVGIRGEPERIWLSSIRVPSRELSEERLEREGPPPGEYDLTKVEYKIVRHPEILHEDGYEFPLGLARIEGLIPRPDKTVRDEEPDEESEEDSLDEESEVGDLESAEVGEGEEDLTEGEGTLDEDLWAEPLLEDDEDVGDVDIGVDIDWDELYAPEIRFLRFCYHDGYKWWDSWDIAGENPLPQLVFVTVGFQPHPPFGEEFGLDEDKINEEFCRCLDEEQLDCEPLDPDQHSIVVRVPQADPLFRSRVSRETQSLVEEFGEEF